MTEINAAHPALARALEARGYSTLTPVQIAMIDPALEGRDLLVSAQTGSGKTVAFGLAMAHTLLGQNELLDKAAAPLALVVAPTRELALQVKRELDWLYAQTGAKVISTVGGMDVRDERRALDQGAHIVVATPGRLVDHIKRNNIDMSAIRAIVLDEADEMLDLGFRDDLEFILSEAPENRRTLMFSATVSRPITALAKRYQNDAERVNTKTEEGQHADIEYRALNIGKGDRENAIINILRYYEAPNALIFCTTRANTNHLMSRLANRGFSVVHLSGELSQKERTHALQAMRDGRARVCVATDVAARGIDLPGLELVIHADLPKNKEGLLHRSGRTGRAGKKGVSVMLVPRSAQRFTERLLQNAGVEAVFDSPPSMRDVEARDNERLLSDPSLTTEPTEAEAEFAAKLLAEHGAERLAAAFVKLHRAGKSAPEDLGKAPAFEAKQNYEPRSGRNERSFDRGDRPERSPRGERPAAKNDFDDGKWISLSVGRKQRAEPRWMLPMLCKAGDLTKANIGSIRIQEHVTFVELNPEGHEKLMAAVGDERRLEKTITVTEVDGTPQLNEPSGGHSDSRPPRKSFDKPFQKAPYKKAPYRGGDDRAPYKKPAYKGDGDKPAYKKPYDRDGGKPAYKKSYDKPAYKGDRAASGEDAPRAKWDTDGPKKPYIKKKKFDSDRPNPKDKGKPKRKKHMDGLEERGPTSFHATRKPAAGKKPFKRMTGPKKTGGASGFAPPKRKD